MLLVPLNLSPTAIRRLQTSHKLNKKKYYTEEISFESAPSLMFVSPLSKSKAAAKSTHSTKQSGLLKKPDLTQKKLSPRTRSVLISSFASAGHDEAVYLLDL